MTGGRETAPRTGFLVGVVELDGERARRVVDDCRPAGVTSGEHGLPERVERLRLDEACAALRLLALVPVPLDAARVAVLLGVSTSESRDALAALRRAHLVTDGPRGEVVVPDAVRTLAADLARSDDPFSARASAVGRLVARLLDDVRPAVRATSPHHDAAGRSTEAPEAPARADQAGGRARLGDRAGVVHVSRLAVDAGFVTPERAWAAIEEAVVMSRPAYASWEQFGDGFLAGRAFWSAGNRTPIDQDLPDFKRAVRRLLDTESSPWRTLAY